MSIDRRLGGYDICVCFTDPTMGYPANNHHELHTDSMKKNTCWMDAVLMTFRAISGLGTCQDSFSDKPITARLSPTTLSDLLNVLGPSIIIGLVHRLCIF
jgi:hypothetical protein